MLLQALLSIFFISTLLSQSLTSLVYEALKNDSLDQIETALAKVESSKQTSLTQAYKGTLTMKKADFMKTPKQKIATFKEGHKLLESEIIAHPKNTEYRFLRLLIQENAPKILKYNKDKEDDKKIIVENFSKLTPYQQSFIREYSKKSTTLTSSDLN